MSEQNQSHSIAESLSALVDNQASELELQRILKASEHDPSVKATWMRYQTVNAVIRGEPAPLLMGDFAARVSAAIDAEDKLNAVPSDQASQTVPQAAQQGWRYQLGRLALVASVAGAAIVGMQQLMVSSIVGTQVANTAPANLQNRVDPVVSLPSGIGNPSLNTRTVGYESRPQESRRVLFQPRQANTTVSDEEVTRYVNQLIQSHSDNAVMNSGQGVLPYARVIAPDQE